MNFQVKLDNNILEWTSEQVKNKLANIPIDLENTLLHPDLATSSSSSSSSEHFMWNLGPKHFPSTHSIAYRINLKDSRIILKQIGKQISERKDQHLIDLFNRAISNFNAIAPQHSIQPVKINYLNVLPSLIKQQINSYLPLCEVIHLCNIGINDKQTINPKLLLPFSILTQAKEILKEMTFVVTPHDTNRTKSQKIVKVIHCLLDIRQLQREKDEQGAKNTFILCEKIIHDFSQLDSLSYNITLSSFISRIARENSQRAEEWANLMENDSIKIGELANLAKISAEIAPEEALEKLKLLKERTKQLHSCVQPGALKDVLKGEIEALIKIGKNQFTNGQTKLAEETLLQVQKKIHQIPLDIPIRKASYYIKVGNIQAENKQVGLATETWGRAIENVHTEKDTEKKVNAFLDIAHVQFKTSQIEAAAETLKWAEEMASQISDLPTKFLAFVQIANFQIKNNQRDAATKHLKQAEEIAYQIKSLSAQSRAFVQIANAQAMNNQKDAGTENLKRAEEIAHQIENQLKKVGAFIKIAIEQSKKDNVKAVATSLLVQEILHLEKQKIDQTNNSINKAQQLFQIAKYLLQALKIKPTSGY